MPKNSKEPLTLATLAQASIQELRDFINANNKLSYLEAAMEARRQALNYGRDAADEDSALSPADSKKDREDLLRKAAEIIKKMDDEHKKHSQNISKEDYAVIAVLNEMQAKYLMERDANSKRKDFFVSTAEDLQTYIQTTLKTLIKTGASGNSAEKQAPIRMNSALMAQIGAGRKLNKKQQHDSDASFSENAPDIRARLQASMQASMTKNQTSKSFKDRPIKNAQQIKDEKIIAINKLLTEIGFLAGKAPAEVAVLIKELQEIKAEVSRYKEEIDAKQDQLVELNRLKQAGNATGLSVEEKIVAAQFTQAITAQENAALSEEKRQKIIQNVAKIIKTTRKNDNLDFIKQAVKSAVVSEVKTAPVVFEKGVAKQKGLGKEQSQGTKIMQEMGGKLLTRSLLNRYKDDSEFYAQVNKYLDMQQVTFVAALDVPVMHAKIVTIYNTRLDDIARADEAEIAKRLKLEAELAATRARKEEAEARALLENEGIAFTAGSVAEFNTNLQARLAQAIKLARSEMMHIPAIIKALDVAITKAESDIPKVHKALSEGVRKGSMVMSADAAVVGGTTAQGAGLSAEQKRVAEMNLKLIDSYQLLLQFLQGYAEKVSRVNDHVNTKKNTSNEEVQKLNAEELGKIIEELKHRQAYPSNSLNNSQINSLITMTIKVVRISSQIEMKLKQSLTILAALSKILDKATEFVHNVQILFGLRKQMPIPLATIEGLELARHQVLNKIQNLRPTQNL